VKGISGQNLGVTERLCVTNLFVPENDVAWDLRAGHVSASCHHTECLFPFWGNTKIS
jgi:hypothetical protein